MRTKLESCLHVTRSPSPNPKGVSFGSSKGSMVETLIYETPLQEEPEVVTPTTETPCPFPNDGDTSDSKNPSTRVRVTFFESSRPQVVHSPEPGDVCLDILDATVMTTGSPSDPPQYLRQTSTDSGWDNPFRPDGDLSREADEIVERIREGLPITGNGTTSSPITDTVDSAKAVSASATGAAPSAAGNGTAKTPSSPGPVTVQRTVIPPGASEPEHVVLKKKPKCRCCVIQ